jgi:hypothetical protein
MIKSHLSFCILCIILTFCSMPLYGDELELRLEYTCEIPEGLEKEVILGQKDGSTETHDAHAAYRYSHSEGWQGLMRRYARSGKIKPEREIAQTWPLMMWAHDIGGSEARTLILKAELVHGEEKVRVAVKRFLEAKENDQVLEQAGADQPATTPESKSEGDVKPQPESEGRSR